MTRITLDDIALEVCNELEIPLRRFCDMNHRSQKLYIARRLFCLIARDERVGSREERAEFLGSTDPSGPSKWAQQGEQRLERNSYRHPYANVMTRLAEPVGGAA